MIVLDCLPNMDAASVAAKTVPLVKYLRANGHPTTPIVLSEIPPTKCESSWYDQASLQRNQDMNDALKASFEALQGDGVTGLHYVRGDEILAGQEGEGRFFNPTVGGTHPADVGQHVEPPLRPPLKPRTFARRGLPSSHEARKRGSAPTAFGPRGMTDRRVPAVWRVPLAAPRHTPCFEGRGGETKHIHTHTHAHTRTHTCAHPHT